MQPNLKVHRIFLRALKEHCKAYNIEILNTMLCLRTAYGLANMNGEAVYEQKGAKAKTEVINLANEVIQLFENL